MANDYRDRPRSHGDRDLDRERWRDDDNRGAFGYEGEGYMHGGARDLEREVADREYERDRDEWDRDREYGGRADRSGRFEPGPGSYRGQSYGRETSRSDYTPSFDREHYGSGRFGRGAYGDGGYMSGGYGSGYSSGYGSDEGYIGGGYMGGDYRGGAWNEAPYRGQNFPQDTPEHFGDYETGSESWRGRGESMRSDARPSFRGRGPKGYQRSDERIREDVCEMLAQDHDVDASDIDVRVSGGIVTLDGNVSERNQKRRAEDVVERILGVKDVENNLRIGREGSSAKGEASSAAGNTAAGTPASTSNKGRPK